MPTGLNLTTLKIAGDAYVCSVAGELDVSSIDALGDELDAIVEHGGRHVVVDLNEVTFLDSSALRLFLRFSNQVTDDGGALIVVSSDPRVLRIFEVTGSGRGFRIEQALATAVHILAG